MTGQGRRGNYNGQPQAQGVPRGGRPARYGMGSPSSATHDPFAGAAGAAYPGEEGASVVSPGYAPPAQGYPAQPGWGQQFAGSYGYPQPGAYVAPATSVPQQPPRRKRGAGFWIAIIVAIIAVVLAVLLALSFCSAQKKSRSGDLGQLEGKSEAEIQAELDRVVQEGMFNISIASVVEMADGASPAELRIENVPNNNYLMQVVITREDTGEEIYRTDVIEQNHHIQSDTLDVDLPAGSYDCLATFTALDPETEEAVGEVAANMRIQVLS